MATITSINPATGQSLASFETIGPADIDAALDKAVAAQRDSQNRVQLKG